MSEVLIDRDDNGVREFTFFACELDEIALRPEVSLEYPEFQVLVMIRYAHGPQRVCNLDVLT